MSTTVKLTDPNVGPLQAIAGGGVDVTMRVTMQDLEGSWKTLGGIMDKEASCRRTSWVEDGNTQDELQLLCGVFAAVTRMLPMCPSNFIEWLRVFAPDRLDDYVTWRLGQMSDDELRNSLAYALHGRDLDALGLERIDEPVSAARKRRGSGAGSAKKAT